MPNFCSSHFYLVTGVFIAWLHFWGFDVLQPQRAPASFACIDEHRNFLIRGAVLRVCLKSNMLIIGLPSAP